MFNRAMKNLQRILENPYFNLIAGLIVLYAAMSEVIRDFHDLDQFQLGAHHGVVLLALVHILKTLPEIFKGLEHMEKAEDK